MVDTIQSVVASAGRDPEASKVGTIRRENAPPKSTSPQKVAGERPVVDSEVLRVVEELNAFVSRIASTTITFEVDLFTGESVVQVRDKETGEVIRQVPPKELLRLAADIKGATGLIFSREA